MKPKIIADTSVWIGYFKNDPELVNFIEKNLLADNICITGVIISELIQGIRSENERKVIRDNIDAVTYIDLKYRDWIKIGELSRDLRKKGITLPLTDISIAYAAIENKHVLATLDSHFELVPGIKLHKL